MNLFNNNIEADSWGWGAWLLIGMLLDRYDGMANSYDSLEDERG